MSGELDGKGLLPCRKCGEDEGQVFANGGEYAVECENCCNRTTMKRTVADAVADWNGFAASPSPSEMDVVVFDGVAKRKLDGLLERGWKVSGYALHREGDHGLITTGGFVGWFSVAERNDADARAKLDQAQSALAAMSEKLAIAERNRDAGRDNFHTMQQSAAELAKKLEQAELREGALLRDCEVYKGHAEDYLRRAIKAETAEAQVLRLTEENEALRKERDEARQAVDAFADICDELGCERDNEAGLEAAHKLKAGIKALEEVKTQASDLVEAIIKGYPDPNVNHENFRVRVTQWAEDFRTEVLALALKENAL